MKARLAPAALLLLLACAPKESPRLRTFPRLVLWAWEEPQDLRFLKGRDIGVAFFAAHLRLRGGVLDQRLRATPLKVDEATPLMAVVRLDGDAQERPTLDQAQLEAVLKVLDAALALPRVRALQLDFDARDRERDFYRRLLAALRAAHPQTPISMTALLSWCGREGWIGGLPPGEVDEAVPMCFRMGPQSEEFRGRLRRGQDFGPDLARVALGISTDEPWDMLPAEWRRRRRLYVFHPGAWSSEDVDRLQKELQR